MIEDPATVILDTPPTRDATPVVLVGGPAEWDHGRRWITGRVYGWLRPNAETPLAVIYTCWVPWRADFAQYAYAYKGAADGVVIMAYRGLIPPDAYNPSIALPGEGP